MMKTIGHNGRRVARVTAKDVHAIHRPVVVALEPGDVIAFREFRRRQWYRIDVEAVFKIAVRRFAEKQAAIKRQERKNKRRGM